MTKNKYSTRFKATLLAFLLSASGIVTAYAITDPQPAQTDFKVERISEELPAVYVETNTYQSSYWAQEATQAGGSLTDILTRIGVNQEDIRQVMTRNNVNLDIENLRTNQSVNVHVGSSGRMTDVQFFIDEELEHNLVVLEKVKGRRRTSNTEIDMKTMPTLRSVQIRTSATGNMLRAEIPSEVYVQLKEISADSFNMSDLKEDDAIRLLRSSTYFRGQQMAVSDILAAEVVRDDRTYQAYYYDQDKGGEESGNYYDQNGKSLQQKEGLSTEPATYTHISSPFGYRIHPVPHTVRTRTGINYVAPTGTLVKAAADSEVIFKGWKGGYGNTVVIRHASDVEALYGRMSTFSPAGGRVRAGEVIGFMGTADRSTSPYLRYETHVNGQPVSPTTVTLPTPELTPTNMAAFRKQQKDASTMLSTTHSLPIPVAQLD